MSTPFDARRGLIVVPVELTGPAGSAILRLALDTGATGTLVNVSLLMALGYDPALAHDRIEVTTGSGVEFASRIAVEKIVALSQSRTSFPILAHTLPPSAGVDGVLGLDFLRGHTLTLDFRQGQIILAE